MEGKRLTNKDGSVNLIKTGIPFWKRISLYHTLLRMNRWKFLACIFLFYTITNVIFAFIYISNGIQHLQGVHPDNDLLGRFEQAYFFSSQTLTTVGYGHISPVGLGANVIASLESFIGIHNMSYEDMWSANIEILVFVKAFDDHFSNIVQQRTSYEISEIIYGARFRRCSEGRKMGLPRYWNWIRSMLMKRSGFPKCRICLLMFKFVHAYHHEYIRIDSKSSGKRS